jgi:hypothetical protein
LAWINELLFVGGLLWTLYVRDHADMASALGVQVTRDIRALPGHDVTPPRNREPDTRLVQVAQRGHHPANPDEWTPIEGRSQTVPEDSARSIYRKRFAGEVTGQGAEADHVPFVPEHRVLRIEPPDRTYADDVAGCVDRMRRAVYVTREHP